MSAMAILTRFKEAMQRIYGHFDDPSSDQLSQWTPPPNSGGHRGRYLWTDAFGVLNFLTLHKESSEDRYLTLAIRLVHAVHEVLGSTRDGKERLPGATDANPLGGGLRIGKEDAGGSDGDGQYHHYLTLWMFALNRLAVATGDSTYNEQAISLARAIHPHFFLHRSSSHPRMVWKITMDMSQPLVASEGNLDPIDGHVVFRLLQARASNKQMLQEEIDDYKRVMDRKGKHFVSTDPLDLGMTLWTSQWLAGKEEWADALRLECVSQLHTLFEKQDYFQQPLRYRLAFREFGTALGIKCNSQKADMDQRAGAIIAEWEKGMESQSPKGLRAITMVMYAAALIPGAFRKGYFGSEPEL